MTTRTARRVDHVVHAVKDLDAAAAAYSEMGFVVTPRADHPFGTSNRLVVLERSYVELVAVTRPELVTAGFADHVRRFLDEGPGIAALALVSDHASADHAALAATGLAIGEVMSFSRPATLADGSVSEASFSNVFSPGFPWLSVFLCQQLTPEAVWDPGYMRHHNGARVIATLEGAGILDTEERRRLAALTGASVTDTAESVRFDLDGTAISLRRMAGAREPGPVLTRIGFGGRVSRGPRMVAGAEITVDATAGDEM